MQIKTSKRYHYMPIKIGEIKKTDYTKCWKGYGKTGKSFWKAVWQFLKKLKCTFTCNLAILPLSTCPREKKAYIHAETNTSMFIVYL